MNLAYTCAKSIVNEKKNTKPRQKQTIQKICAKEKQIRLEKIDTN